MLIETDRVAATQRLNRHLPSHLQYKDRDLDIRLNEIGRHVSDWWSRSNSDARFWLAFGLDLMFDCGFLNSRKQESQPTLVDRFEAMVAEANEADPEAWSPSNIVLGKTWLQITPYTLWRMVEDAREAGFAEVEDTLFEAAQGVSDGSSIAKAIERSFSKSVMDWQTAFERGTL